MKEITSLTHYIDYLGWAKKLLVPPALKKILYEKNRSDYEVILTAIGSSTYKAAWILPGLKQFFTSPSFTMCLWLHKKNLLSEELFAQERLQSIYVVLRKIIEIEQDTGVLGLAAREYRDAALYHPQIDALCTITDICLKRNLLNDYSINHTLEVLLAVPHSKLVILSEILQILDQRHAFYDSIQATSYLKFILSHQDIESLYATICMLNEQEDQPVFCKQISALLTYTPPAQDSYHLVSKLMGIAENVTSSGYMPMPPLTLPSARKKLPGLCGLVPSRTSNSSSEDSPQYGLFGFAI